MGLKGTLYRRYRNLSTPWRMLPSALIIGAQKAGTTSLFNYLTQHPKVTAPDKKELHYFAGHYSKGPSWYRSHFPLSRPGRLTLEASTGYLNHPHVPRRVAADLPEVKLIALLRDPVERAWSHYHHSVRRGSETLSFEEALASEDERLGEYYRRIEHDPNARDPGLGPFSYLSRGRYAEQLERWFAAFPRERLLILQSEVFFAQPEKMVQETLCFLGLPPLEGGRFKPFKTGDNKDEPMSADTRAELKNYFAPHNARLYDLLGVDFGW